MTQVAPRITPPLDELNRPFWTGGASGVLRITRCQSCRRWVFPLSATCPDAASSTVYEATSGKGTVFTHTTNSHPYNPAVPVPYNISIVELVEQEGLRSPPTSSTARPRTSTSAWPCACSSNSTARCSCRSSCPMPRSQDLPAELEPVDAVEAPTVLGDLDTLGEPVVGYATVPFLERDPQLTPGQVRAEAPVRPGAEREVVVVGPIEVHLARILELGRIAGRHRSAGRRPCRPPRAGSRGSPCPP